jgi:hypothetical protein
MDWNLLFKNMEVECLDGSCKYVDSKTEPRAKYFSLALLKFLLTIKNIEKIQWI